MNLVNLKINKKIIGQKIIIIELLIELLFEPVHLTYNTQ